MEQIILRKVVEYDGEKITELNLDLEGLTAKDLMDVEKELTVTNGITPVKEFDKTYLAFVAAKAAGVDTDLMKMLGAKDFTKITVLVQNFLLNEE